MSAAKEYDLVLLGATGYTGKLTAEYIVSHLPTDIKWAVAGRNAKKLGELVEELKPLNPDRNPPGVETVQLELNELNALAKRTKIILNCVGPYYQYSFPVVEACAKTGTHYLDVTGETPFVKKVIEDFEETAKANGALLIPQVGVDSSPSDLLAFTLVSLLRDKYSLPTNEIISCVNELKSTGPSGGTTATIFYLISTFGLSELAKQSHPYILSPLSPQPQPRIPLFTKLFGIRTIPGLGTLTTSVLGTTNVSIVHRSSGLMRKLYGPDFHYAEYALTRNRLTGLLMHFGIILATLCVAFPPTRWILQKFVSQPGEGSTREAAMTERLDMSAIATADQKPGKGQPKRAYGRFVYEGSIYYQTGLLLSEAAMVILKDEQGLVKSLGGGGVFTPATLGDAFVERVRRAGCVVETNLMDD